jgi:hypothetical protein
MIPVRQFVCLGCGGPRRISHEIAPGHYMYAPCDECGEIGLVRKDDNYLPPIKRPKKANREPYERSRYRGGKLHA